MVLLSSAPLTVRGTAIYSTCVTLRHTFTQEWGVLVRVLFSTRATCPYAAANLFS